MGKALYEIRLDEPIIPAKSSESALEEHAERSGLELAGFASAHEIVPEETTLKLFMLAKMMQDSEKFVYNEIWTAVCAVMRMMNCTRSVDEVATCICTWTERFEDMTMEELQEWVIN